MASASICTAASSVLPLASSALARPMRAGARPGEISRAFSKEAWAASGFLRDSSSSPFSSHVCTSSAPVSWARSSCRSADFTLPPRSSARARPRRASLLEGSLANADSNDALASLTFSSPSWARPRSTSHSASKPLAEIRSMRRRASS